MKHLNLSPQSHRDTEKVKRKVEIGLGIFSGFLCASVVGGFNKF